MSYYDRKEISNSDLDHIAKSYADFMTYKMIGQEDTDAMKFGRMFHAYVLEDKQEFVVDSEIVERIGGKRPRATKEYKEWKEAQNVDVITDDDFTLLSSMKTAIFNHRIAGELLKASDKEVEKEIYFNIGDVECRSKLDLVSPEQGLIVDVKTIKELTLEDVVKAISYKYYRQGAFYTEACRKEYGRDFDFKFIFVEKKMPFKVAVVTLNDDFQNKGIFDILSLLSKYKAEKKMNGGYFQGEWDVQCPSWMKIDKIQTDVIKTDEEEDIL